MPLHKFILGGGLDVYKLFGSIILYLISVFLFLLINLIFKLSTMNYTYPPAVLVTGFGPFRDYKVNASWEAVKLLPEMFEEHNKQRVNLIIEEIPVGYEEVSTKVNELWETHKPAIIIHVGVSSIAKCLTLELQACNKGYHELDAFQRSVQERDEIEFFLKSRCDVEKVQEIVNKTSADTNVKACTSTNAGRYLCEYIYYQSLKLKEPLVLFVHVPDLSIYSSEQTAQGLLQILIHLIDCSIGKK